MDGDKQRTSEGGVYLLMLFDIKSDDIWIVSQSFNRDKKNVFEYIYAPLHPSTPLPKQQQAATVCVCVQVWC